MEVVVLNCWVTATNDTTITTNEISLALLRKKCSLEDP
jgi:hypothetical protein